MGAVNVSRCKLGVDPNTRNVALVASLLLTLGGGCSQGNYARKAQKSQVAYTIISDPVRELCTDDSESRTEYFSVHLVRFVGPLVWLDGTPVTAEALQRWTIQKYGNLPEKVLRVQFSQADEHAATQALIPILASLPDVHIRRAPYPFTCPKL